MDLFKKQLARGENDILKSGNYRAIQKYDLHDLKMIYTEDDESLITWASFGIGIGAMVILVSCLILFCTLNMYKLKQLSEQKDENEELAGAGEL